MLKKAAASFLSAQNDFETELYDRAISSLYYSAFQTIVALMLLRGESVSKHTHVRSFVNKELKLPGHIPIELSNMYNVLMGMRADADYNAEIFFTRDEVGHLITQVEEFNRIVRKLIENESKIT